MSQQRIYRLILLFLLISGGIITTLPFVWMLSSSFKTNVEISSLQQQFLPQALSFANYENVFSKLNFLRYFANSLFYAGTLTLITVYTSSVSGFVLSKYRFKGREALFSAIVATMMVPGIVTMIPRYSIMQGLGLLDTYRALLIPSFFTSFGIFLMRQSCKGIPDEMLEAARIDGANEYYVFHRIVFPMLRNAISSIAIFQFLWAWEDYLWPYLMIRTQDKQVLSVALNMFSGRYSTDYAGLFAATSITIIPVIVCYLIFQRRFIAGISSAAVKG